MSATRRHMFSYLAVHFDAHGRHCSEKQVTAHSPMAAARKFIHGVRTQALLHLSASKASQASEAAGTPSTCGVSRDPDFPTITFPKDAAWADCLAYETKLRETLAVEAQLHHITAGTVMVVRTHNGHTTPFHYTFRFRALTHPTNFQVSNRIVWRMTLRRVQKNTQPLKEA